MQTQASLKIYKASAGSGKTYRLVVEYLKLIIENPITYTNILAVTFTNKATAEMKTRILTELFGIVKGLKDSESYLNTIQKELKEKNSSWTVNKIQTQAQIALNLLLHDYSRFRIETIDSFFQSILRNLAKELGLGAYMNIELNTDSVLKDAVTSVFGKVKDNPELLQWISDYIDEKVSEGSNWKLNKELEQFGKNIFKENFKNKEKELQTVLQDKTFLKNFRNRLLNLRTVKTEEIVSAAASFRIEIEKKSIKTEDFLYGTNGVAGYFNKIIDKKDIFSEMGTRAIKCIEEPESWTKKDSPMREKIIMLASEIFIPILQKTEEIRKRNVPTVNSCNLILRHINNIGLLYDIADTVRELNSENNRFMLADTPNLLQELIDGNDAPFIYEKIGASIQNIMIDEFQDTSKVQWENFKPLLMEGLAQNADSLIVGDQKQSIYRWRNGDWRILGNLKNELSNTKTEEICLNINWRSEYEIIRFNNAIFQAAIPLLQNAGDETDKYTEMKTAYSDIIQKCSKEKQEGYVKAEFLCEENNDSYVQKTLERLVQNIEELQEKGIKAEEIAILVRKNKSVPLIAEYLSDYRKTHPEKKYNYEIISDQAYRLDTSLAIRILIDALRYISNPQSLIYKIQLLLDYQTEIAKEKINDLVTNIHLSQSEIIQNLDKKLKKLSLLPLYELIEELYRILELHKIEKQESYLYSFLDGINDFIKNKSSDIIAFLEYWEESLKDKTIPFSSEINGMRIISVHKSKGLEFHSVLIPFCDWTLTHESGLNPILWCNTETEPFNLLPLFPIKYGKEMKNSVFNREYTDENEQLLVDNINLLYVAFTRAKKNMILIGKASDKNRKEKKPSGLKNISELLLQILESPNNTELHSCWNSETKQYISGKLYISPKEETKEETKNKLKKKPEVLTFPYFSHIQKIRFKQSNRSNDFIEEEKQTRNSYINRGKLLHYLFANIQTVSDIPQAIDRLFFEGLIQNEVEKKELFDFVSKSIQKTEVSVWFRPGIKLFNECVIIYRDENGTLQNKRPDRVIQDNDKMTIIDFKFGKQHKEHITQVKEYITLLQKMGHIPVEGFLWYVIENEIKKI